MINGKRISVVTPAYDAERTLERTVRELPDTVGVKIFVDDSSSDKTAMPSEDVGVQTFVHHADHGYGLLPLLDNSDEVVLSIRQSMMFGLRIEEISCPTKCFEGASSIKLQGQRATSAERVEGVLKTTASFAATAS
jgi:hypothetical protein